MLVRTNEFPLLLDIQIKEGGFIVDFFSVGIFWTIPTKHKCSPTEVMIITIKLSTLGITPQKAKQFEKKGICSAEDLLRYIPKSYKDYRQLAPYLIDGAEQACLVTVDEVKSFGQELRYKGSYVQTSSKTPMLIAYCTMPQSGQKLVITWFRQNYLFRKVSSCVGETVYVAGKVGYNTKYNNFTMTAPEIFEPSYGQAPGIRPIYAQIGGMSDAYLREKIQEASDRTIGMIETLPIDYLDKKGLQSFWTSLKMLHFPTSEQHIKEGQARLLQEDLVYFAMANEWAARKISKGSQFSIRTHGWYEKIKASLPYSLTQDQVDAIESMIQFAADGHRINALVQGDVGCGKSIVAFCMMMVMAENGYQAAVMAPTLVLARQHYEELSALAAPFGVNVAWLGSDLKASEKKKVLAAIKDGDASLIVGTQSIIGESVEYKNLALTVTDEEHKFGVDQRAALVEKASGGVHAITMSATPIPRSLAQVLYGDTVQLHTIKTMPNGRLPVITGIATSKEKIFRFILLQKRKGYQTYVVCPLIDKSEKLEGVQSVEEVSEEYRSVLEPYGVRIETITGKTPKDEADNILSRFKNGKVDVLVSTTVVEVGVNVPTATMMVIVNADRFGLSSLHQLRGRVGRSNVQSYCVLDAGPSPTPAAMERLNAMVQTNNGFEIAEADLRIRGAGDFLGTEQSGWNRYMTLMMAYPAEYEEAKKDAKELLNRGKGSCKMVDSIIGAGGN